MPLGHEQDQPETDIDGHALESGQPALSLCPDGDWVEIHNDVDWKTPGTLVKAAFPMTASRSRWAAAPPGRKT